MNQGFGGRQPFSRGVLNSGKSKRGADAAIKFPPSFDQKCEISKVNMESIIKWVPGRIIDLCGGEDEVVISYVEEMLKDNRGVCPRNLQINLTGFLHEKAPGFATEIWKLILDGQNQPDGVPKSLVGAETRSDAEVLTEEALKARIQAFNKQLGERVGEEKLNKAADAADAGDSGKRGETRRNDGRDRGRDSRDSRNDRDKRDRDRNSRRDRRGSRSRSRRRERSRSRSPPRRDRR